MGSIALDYGIDEYQSGRVGRSVNFSLWLMSVFSRDVKSSRPRRPQGQIFWPRPRSHLGWPRGK